MAKILKSRLTQPLPLTLAVSAALLLGGCSVEWMNLQPAREVVEQAKPPGEVYAGWRVYQDKCAACHGVRNAMGATIAGREFDGAPIPGQGWYAPALTLPHEAGVAHWSPQRIVQLLKTGSTARASMLGPMAEVVQYSTRGSFSRPNFENAKK